MLTMRVWLALVVWLIATAVIGFLAAPRANAGFVDGAAVLSFATLAAVGIERMLELMWSFASASQRAGGWWPLKQVTEAIDTVLNETNAFLGDHVKDAIDALNKTKKTVEDQPAKVKEIDDTIAAIAAMQKSSQTKLDQAQKLAPGSERLALIAAISADASSQLNNGLGLAGDLSADAKKLIDQIRRGDRFRAHDRRVVFRQSRATCRQHPDRWRFGDRHRQLRGPEHLRRGAWVRIGLLRYRTGRDPVRLHRGSWIEPHP